MIFPKLPLFIPLIYEKIKKIASNDRGSYYARPNKKTSFYIYFG